LFFKQLATLLQAGIPLLQCLEMLATTQAKFHFMQLILCIKQDILSGKNLYHSLKPHSIFDPLCCQLIQLGEQTGKLDEMILQLATYLERKIQRANQYKQILFYPCMVIFIACIITFSLMIFVIPHFAELFADRMQELPFFSLFIFKCSDFLVQFSAFIFCFLFFALFLIYLQRKKIWAYLQSYMTHFPFIRHYQKQYILIRFARHLALCLHAGMPILNAISVIAGDQLNSPFCKLRNKVSIGMQLYEAMHNMHYFPPLMIQLAKIGEETGQLPAMLDYVAQLFESQVEKHIARLQVLLEPLIVLVLGVLIGGLVIGMYLPIFKLGNAL
jgi:type IV pilus assembly protein PilC